MAGNVTWRSLYIALKSRYNLQAHNNGRIFLSQRKAAAEINSNLNQITRWFRELQYYGFIVMVTPGYLGVDGKGKSPRWRLTELGYMTEPPSRDFLHWNGIWFSNHEPGGDRARLKPKTESRSRKGGHPVAEKGDTPVAEKGDTLRDKCSRKGGHTADQGVAEKGDKSSLTTGYGSGGALSEREDRPDRTLPLMTVIDGGKVPRCAYCRGTAEPLFRFKNGCRPYWLHRRCRTKWLAEKAVS